MKITGIVASTGVLLALATGCSGGDTTKAEPSSSPVAKVSLQTTCDRLFLQPSGDQRLWSRATALVAAASNGESVDDAEAESVTSDLKDLAASAVDELQPHVKAMATATGDLDSVDTSDYKTAATEVSNQCAPYVAGG